MRIPACRLLTFVPDQPKHFTRIDGLLLLMTFIWGTNYSIVKAAFSEIEPQAFNGVSMPRGVGDVPRDHFFFHRSPAGARAVDHAADRANSVAGIFHTPAALTLRDRVWLAGLGVIGHFAYQYCFIGGLARTSVANSSLMLAATPVVIALLSAMLGQERVRAWVPGGSRGSRGSRGSKGFRGFQGGSQPSGGSSSWGGLRRGLLTGGGLGSARPVEAELPQQIVLVSTRAAFKAPDRLQIRMSCKSSSRPLNS